MVSIDAFQALDPGSIPGHRTLLNFLICTVCQEPGLRWYHGHDFADHVNGLYGAFMVHEKGDGQNVYDPTTVILSDILHEGISHSMSEGWMASSFG